MNKDEVRKLAKTLMFDVSDLEYDEIKNELDRNIQSIENISKVEGIEQIDPMFYPFNIESNLREDVVVDSLSCDDILKNVKNKQYNQTKLPKVVE